MQVIYWSTARLLSWLPLQHLEDRNLFTEVSTRLENLTKEFIIQHGRLHSLRIAAPTPWRTVRWIPRTAHTGRVCCPTALGIPDEEPCRIQCFPMPDHLGRPVQLGHRNFYDLLARLSSSRGALKH